MQGARGFSTRHDCKGDLGCESHLDIRLRGRPRCFRYVLHPARRTLYHRGEITLTNKNILIFKFLKSFMRILQQQNMCQIMASQQNSFLYTVSRLVSSRDIRRRGSEEEGGRLLHVTDPDPTVKPKHIPKPPILETLFYIHLIALFAILSMCWIDTLPGIGRVCSYWYIIEA